MEDMIDELREIQGAWWSTSELSDMPIMACTCTISSITPQPWTSQGICNIVICHYCMCQVPLPHGHVHMYIISNTTQNGSRWRKRMEKNGFNL